MTSVRSELVRIPSGVPGLDAVLQGGFFAGGVYIVQGSPGSGKTVLANQMAFAHARTGGRVLHVTLLAEDSAQLLQNLRTLAFFDESAVPDRIFYISAFMILEKEGLPGLLNLLRREIQARQSTMLVIDGFLNIEGEEPSIRAIKKFLHELQTQLRSMGCLGLLLTDGADRQWQPERTLVDGILVLGRETLEARGERHLEVLKLRASGHLEGRHALRITRDGHRVFPRFEARYATSGIEDAPPRHSLPTGIAGLDQLTHGGLPAASTTVVIGASGVGKTTLGLQFLAAAAADDPVLFFGFYESPDRLLRKAELIGCDLRDRLSRGSLEFCWQLPTEQLLDELGERLVEAVRARTVRRLVVDGLGGFMGAASHPGRINRFFAALANELRVLGVTTLYTMETRDLVGDTVRVPIDNISSLVENLLYLRFVEVGSRMRRLLAIVKMRDSDFDPLLREFHITDRGIVIGEPIVGTEALMSGFGHRVQPVEPPFARKSPELE